MKIIMLLAVMLFATISSNATAQQVVCVNGVCYRQVATIRADTNWCFVRTTEELSEGPPHVRVHTHVRMRPIRMRRVWFW